MNTDNKWLIPKYAIIPVAIYMLMIPSYFIAHLLTENASHVSMGTALDESIPLIPGFIWIYVLAYLQWFIGYFVIARSSEDLCKTVFSGHLIAKSITILLFIILPTTIVRPAPTESGLTFDMLRWMYSIDSPTNLFPSLHCLESWIVARGLMKTNASKYAKTAMWLFSILVFMSFVFVKQHFIVDIIGGIAAVEIGLILSRKLNLRRLYDAIEHKIHLL